MFDAKKTIDYFKRTPAYKDKSYENMNDDELESVLFDAYEDIVSLYPSVTVSPRMIVKQMLFKKKLTIAALVWLNDMDWLVERLMTLALHSVVTIVCSILTFGK